MLVLSRHAGEGFTIGPIQMDVKELFLNTAIVTINNEVSFMLIVGQHFTLVGLGKITLNNVNRGKGATFCFEIPKEIPIRRNELQNPEVPKPNLVGLMGN